MSNGSASPSLCRLSWWLSVVCMAIADDGAFMSKLAKALTPTPSGWSTTSGGGFCSWNGVKCDSSNRVTMINLRSMSLSGTLPSHLNSLDQLTTLSLQNNSLSGELPSLANLTMLQTVYLDGNNFTSVSGGCFEGLTSLQTLSMTDNINLRPWTIPAELTQSTNLVELDLENTNLVGTLPDIFGPLVSLQGLRLSDNNLNGCLPQSFAGSGIQNLWLNLQNFTGSIDVLASMTQLSQVWLHSNSLTGTIPDLTNCTGLFDLQLRDNLLTGVVPPSLMALSSLKNVSLDNNMLQGPFPSFGKGVKVSLDEIISFCQTTPGPCDPRVTTLLDIAADFGYPLRLASSWVGNDPCQEWSFIVCSEGKIVTVNLAKQNLTGTISPAFAHLTDLKKLYLGDNNLTGPIPGNLTNLTQLEVLDMSNNNLSGQIPEFSSKVRFNYIGNVLLGRSGDSVGSGPTTSSGFGDAPSPSVRGSGSSLSPAWIAVASVGAVVAVVIVLACCFRTKIVFLLCWKKSPTHRIIEEFLKEHGPLPTARYSYSDVKKITNSFRDKLGQGGYGSVYKGKLHDGRVVAVKILSKSKGDGEEFINEVASICRTSHVNIVRLLGFCLDGSERALMFEFMPNGSLEKFIYEETNPLHVSHQLDCKTLYDIAIGVARGLEYLHRGCNTRILHFDIKPHNILLDEDFCPKISDFGLAKICTRKESRVSIFGARGTAGYIAPEVFSRNFGAVSHKSDVYSYGMMILEMVGRRKNINAQVDRSSEIYFPHWIYNRLESNQELGLQNIRNESDNEMVRKMTIVGLWCIQTNPSTRPLISKVVEMLEGRVELLQMPPKPFLFSPSTSSVHLSYETQ